MLGEVVEFGGGGGFAGGGDGVALELGDGADTGFGELEHVGELGAAEGGFFAAALKFDELEVFGHDDVEIDGGVFVFDVVKIEERCAVNDAARHGGDEFLHWVLLELSLGEKFFNGDADGDAGSGDGCGAGAAVGLENVAVDPNGARSEGLEVDHGTHGATDETLDFDGSPVLFAA